MEYSEPLNPFVNFAVKISPLSDVTLLCLITCSMALEGTGCKLRRKKVHKMQEVTYLLLQVVPLVILADIRETGHWQQSERRVRVQ